MLFIIIYDAKDEKLAEIAKFEESKKGKPPEGVEHKAEYVTPNGKFIELCEAANERVLLSYVTQVGTYPEFNKKIDIFPVVTIDEWVEEMKKTLERIS